MGRVLRRASILKEINNNISKCSNNLKDIKEKIKNAKNIINKFEHPSESEPIKEIYEKLLKENKRLTNEIEISENKIKFLKNSISNLISIISGLEFKNLNHSGY